MKRQRPEAQLHMAVAHYLRVALRPPVVWSTIGHGGGGKVRGAQLKAMGLRKGMPDLLVIAPGPVLVGIELKSKVGKQTPEQFQVATDFKDCGAWLVLCRSVEEVERALRYCKIPMTARVMT